MIILREDIYNKITQEVLSLLDSMSASPYRLFFQGMKSNRAVEDEEMDSFPNFDVVEMNIILRSEGKKRQ